MAEAGDFTRKMLLLLMLLGAATCVLTWEGPAAKKSRPALHPQEVKMVRSSANAILKRGKRAYDYFERFFWRVKSPLELKKEQCESYWLCNQFSESVGFYNAYRRFFGPI